MEKVPLTVVVITKNEEEKIAKCLGSAGFADEIIVVDDESADRTVEIARKYTDRIIVKKMDIEGKHRNYAYAQAEYGGNKMLEKNFVEMLTKMEEKEHTIMCTKGMEYTTGDQETNRFANFYRLGKELDLDPKMVLWIYLKKHLDSILCYIKKGKEYSEEKIEGRIHDARNYLALLNGIIIKQRKE